LYGVNETLPVSVMYSYSSLDIPAIKRLMIAYLYNTTKGLMI
jgi:hypothetical protein